MSTKVNRQACMTGNRSTVGGFVCQTEPCVGNNWEAPSGGELARGKNVQKGEL